MKRCHYKKSIKKTKVINLAENEFNYLTSEWQILFSSASKKSNSEYSLTITNGYDSQGRRIACSIPAADCRIEYSYHGLDPQSVQRKTLNGQTLYTHQYLSYDLSGNLLEEDLIDNCRVRLTIIAQNQDRLSAFHSGSAAVQSRGQHHPSANAKR